MKELLKKPVTFEKVEFWVATILYIFAAFVLVGQIINPDENQYLNTYFYLFHRHHIPYSYTRYYILPEACRYTVYYCSFIALNFFIIKRLVTGKRILVSLLLVLCLYIITAILLGTADTWLRGYLFDKNSEDYVYNLVFKEEFVYSFWILAIFSAYTLAKYISRSLMLTFGSPFSGNAQVTQECLVALGVWVLIACLFKISSVNWKSSVMWSEAMLYGIGLYWYVSYKVIPDTIARSEEFREYLLRVIVILFITVPPVAIIAYAIFHRLNSTFYINAFNTGLSLFIVAPFAWFLSRYRLARNQELYGLKTALGHSAANLDFLRSQINPHFLFNALNTLYGTAMQENADRTGEGIQKLGDMMRFMLQENVQEKISLSREIDYLNNYIDLQKLRTQTSPDILIQVEIEEQLVSAYQITPMLLIPFVENAFKHGISLREPSHIKITLHVEDNTLLFDVYNSIHLKAGNDPEKDKSGIGLENVKQRLQLLYPSRHELIIRENTKEFFIHLTLNLI